MVQYRWFGQILEQNLCTSKPGIPETNYLVVSWFQDSWTFWILENAGVSITELLVVPNVEVYKLICQHLWSLLVHQTYITLSSRQVIFLFGLQNMIGHVQHQFCKDLGWNALELLLVWVDKENSIEFPFVFCTVLIYIFVFTLIYKVLHVSFESFPVVHLVIWPSYDTTSLLRFLVLRNFTVCNRGQPCSLFCHYLLLSTPLFLSFLVQFLPSLSLLFLLFFTPFSFPLSIASSFFPTLSSILHHIFCPSTQIIFSP